MQELTLRTSDLLFRSDIVTFTAPPLQAQKSLFQNSINPVHSPKIVYQYMDTPLFLPGFLLIFFVKQYWTMLWYRTNYKPDYEQSVVFTSMRRECKNNDRTKRREEKLGRGKKERRLFPVSPQIPFSFLSLICTDDFTKDLTRNKYRLFLVVL